MFTLTGRVCCFLVVLWSLSNTVTGQSCNCSIPGNCNPPRLCYPGSQQCNRENVALGRLTNMSSVFTPPCRAVDGIVPLPGDGDCLWAESRPGDRNAWWNVDLGQNYTITNITIYRRASWPTRMADVHVKVDGQLCYRFPTHAEGDKLNNLPVRMDIQCDPPLTGRVVWLQKVNADLNDSFITHIINICEVQVWGCAPGYYGADCDPCGHCAGVSTCDIVTGVCPSGCLAGWQGPQCLQPCAAGYYGERCTVCGNCTDGTTCDSTTGRCPSGCKAGWQGERCLQQCAGGYYGPDCSSCGHCIEGSTCNTVTGQCPHGCQDGWRGMQCRESEETSSSLVGPVVGAIIGGCALIGLIMVIPIIICMRLKKSRQSATCEHNQQLERASKQPQSREITVQQDQEENTSVSQQDGGSSYEDVTGQNQYDSLQPADQRPDEKSVYTNPVFKSSPA